MIATVMTIALTLSVTQAEPQEETIWGKDFEKVEFVGQSWFAYRMHQPEVPIPVSREVGEMLMYDRCLGIPGTWGDYEYGFSIWTDLGEIILNRVDPYAHILPGGGADEMDDFDD